MAMSIRVVAVAVVAAFAAVSSVVGQGPRTYPNARTGGNYMHNYYLPPAPASTPWAPAWSPDGKSIAVAMSGSIWNVDPSNGVAHELTYDATYHSTPDWSPDGNWIIYTADNGGTSIQLAIVNVATGETRALTDDEFVYTDPVFSPDGSRVAYVSTRPNGFFNVFVRAIKNGQWAGEEIAVSRDAKYRNSRLYFGEEDLHITPTWTRDGKQLLLVSNRGVPLGSGHVWLVPAVAGGIDDARTVVVEQTLYRARPHVSIDGKRFVYSSTRGAADQFSNLYVQPVAGGEPYKLTFFDHDAFHPRWSPDGEWIAYIDNRQGLPQLALLEVYGGANRIVRIVDRRWKRPTGVLSVRTADQSGQATGARIHLTAADGKFYAPADAYARVSAAGDRIFHSTGEFRVELPVGKVRVTAVKGFEVWPQTAEIDIVSNEVATAEIRLKQLTDMSVKGWHNGSTHVHMNYGGNLHNTLENLMMMSAAEDQDIVLEQVANKDNRILDHQFFVAGGGPHPLSRKDMLLVVGQEYRPPFWGHVFMFGLRDHLISPFTTGYEGTAIESLYPSNTDMFRKGKAQGAYVGYVHAYGGERDPLEAELGGAKGAIVDAALGTTDAIEWSAAGRSGFFPIYALWNNGLKVAAVGGEDSISNLHMSKLVGSHRTYVFTGGRGLEMHAWLDGMRAGRAFVTNGPLVELSVNGALPGETVTIPSGGGNVDVQAHIRSIVPLETVTLFFNGQPLDTIPLSADRKSADFRKTLPIAKSGWLHVRAEGAPADRFPLDTSYPQGFTNPVWVVAGNQPVRDRASAEYALRWIDKLHTLAEAWPGWRSSKEKAHVYGQFEEARKVYRRLASEAR
jgi:dipeptidyl aminopeptidase/acylaminoacyl peptidase